MRDGVLGLGSGFCTRGCGCKGVEGGKVLSGEEEGDSVMLVLGEREVGAVVVGGSVEGSYVYAGLPIVVNSYLELVGDICDG